MALTLELTTEQFMKLYGDEEYLKGFSSEAVEHILTYIGNDQQEWGLSSISWERVFEKSREMDVDTIANEGNEILDDMAYKVLDMATSTLTGLSEEVYEQLTDQDIDDHNELLIKLLPEFRKTKEWLPNVAKFIATAKGYTSLSNGNYLTIVE